MNINIEKVEIHYHNGKEKEIPCKDKDLCEKAKFNQQVEDIISSNREKSFQQCEAILGTDITLLNDTQNASQSLVCERDSEKEVLSVQSSSSPLASHKLESENIRLANILRQNYAPLDRVAQSLLKQETSRIPRRKKHGESLESCLLHQTANLLHILSARVIPYLERLDNNKNQHS